MLFRIPSLLVPAVLLVTLCSCRALPVLWPQPAPTMTPPDDVREQVLAALDALNTRVRARDLDGAFALFAEDAEALIVGSSEGEIARGPEEIRALLARLFGASYTVGWSWDVRRVASAGQVAWLYAEGEVVLQGPDGETRRPYRVSGVFVRTPTGWRWAQFHGSEPAAE